MHHLPNLVTLARALAGVLGAALLLQASGAATEASAVAYGLASAAIFGVAALSDWLDGWLARRMGVAGALGALLDPIADKVLVGAYLIAYVIIAGFDAWLAVPVAIVIARDVLITGLRLRSGAPETLAVSPDAKVKTAIQMIVTALPFALTATGWDVAIWYHYWIGGVWFLAILTVWTALPYLRAARAR